LKVLYITTNFSALSSTFITREINQLRALGHKILLLGTRLSKSLEAENPEADLVGIRHIYPIPFFHGVASFFKLALLHPQRVNRALGIALGSNGDTFLQKLKLLYQLFAVSRFADWLEKEGVDHIHAHFATTPTTFAMFLATLTQRTFTFTDHGSGLFHDQIGVQKKFETAAGISAISQYNVGFYDEVAAQVPPVQIVRCGLSMEDFPFSQRESMGNPIRILAISRIVPKKGFQHLLGALKILQDDGVPFELKMVGTGSSLPELESQAKNLKLDKVEFTGPMQQEDIRQLLQTWDLLILPCVVAPDGDMDGIPVTLMEAMACGCPVISTRLSGIPELIKDGETGVLLEAADPKAISEAIFTLRDNPDFYAKLSRGGRNWVNEEFNIKESAKRLSGFFEKVGRDR